MPHKYVRLVLLGIALLVGGWDVALLLDDVEGNTISSQLQQDSLGWVIGLLGFAGVHVARKPDGKPRSWLLTGAGAVAAAGVGFALGGGVLSLILGGLAGWFAWGNQGKA